MLALDYLVIRRRIPFTQIDDVRLHEVKEFGKGLALYRALEDRWRAATGR